MTDQPTARPFDEGQVPGDVTPADERELERADDDVQHEQDERELVERQRRLEGKPILSGGSAGPAVFELGRLLAEAGFETSISRGENAYGVYDASVQAAVDAFRADYDVEEDAAAFGAGDQGRRTAAAVVGPATWAALLDATE